MLYPYRVHVTVWLGVSAFLVFCMVILGGSVRVTGSGLSMVDWQPLMGVFPPLGQSAWQEVYSAYMQSPEGELVNAHMALNDFKFIFYMEYLHRVLGRLVGLVYFLPFCFFLLRGGLPPALISRSWLVFILGAAQGLMGWYMVQSGLIDDPHVSHYRLTAHLLLAVIIFVALIRLIVGVWIDSRTTGAEPLPSKVPVGLSGLVLAVVLLMIASGGMMAGTRAGHIFNTWPLMGESLLPPMVMALEPWWRNLLENTVAIQFVHRWLAIFTAGVVILLSIRVLQRDTRRIALRSALAAAILVIVQVVLGITTLVSGTPPIYAVAHQGTGLLLTGAVALLWSSYRQPLVHRR